MGRRELLNKYIGTILPNSFLRKVRYQWADTKTVPIRWAVIWLSGIFYFSGLFEQFLEVKKNQVLWIRSRIRPDPKLFSGSGSGIKKLFISDSANSKLQWLKKHEICWAPTRYCQLTILLLVQKIPRYRTGGFKNLFFEIKIFTAVLY